MDDVTMDGSSSSSLLEEKKEKLEEEKLQEEEAIASSSSSISSSSIKEEEEEEDSNTFLEAALTFKEKGNAALKALDYKEALEAYENGLKKLVKSSSKNDDMRTLKLSIHLNLALTHLKLKNWNEGIEAASKALELDSTNCKALFRRGFCHSQSSNYEKAKADLMKCLEIDRTNVEARKELHSMTQRRQAAAAKDKIAFSGLFGKSAGALYADREEQRELRDAKLKEEFDKTTEKEDGETFEQWKLKKEEKERKDLELKQKEGKEREKEQSLLGSKSQSSPPKKKAAIEKEEDIEYDEEEKKLLESVAKKGYCYFQSGQQEVRPTTILSPVAAATDQSLGASSPTPGTAATAGVSQWNVGGTTYEEKDTSTFCKSTLRECFLKEAKWTSNTEHVMQNIQNALKGEGSDPALWGKVLNSVSNGGNEEISALTTALISTSIVTKKVNELSGDSQVMVVKGTLRYFFDFSIDLEWSAQLTTPGNSTCEYEGRLKCDDVSSIDNSLVKNMVVEFKNKATVEDSVHKTVLENAIAQYKVSVLNAVKSFFEKYKKAF